MARSKAEDFPCSRGRAEPFLVGPLARACFVRAVFLLAHAICESPSGPKARSWNVRSHAAVGRKAAPIRGIGEDDRPKAS
jgi:hypothetical protein